MNGDPLPALAQIRDGALVLRFPSPLILQAGARLQVDW
jgi:hypothetical protein